MLGDAIARARDVGPADRSASDPAADPVRDFYTHHPYPPPVDNLDRARDEWRDENRHRAEFHLVWPERPYRTDLDILVAGCGTWQAAKHALCRPHARVVGIDAQRFVIQQALFVRPDAGTRHRVSPYVR